MTGTRKASTLFKAYMTVSERMTMHDSGNSHLNDDAHRTGLCDWRPD